ncbi:hypothetical protein G9A89_020983 [Geosiphon pyriformis]|nr:hypothetical protein G9A89_020983 [Geosiphon pyriformis]
MASLLLSASEKTQCAKIKQDQYKLAPLSTSVILITAFNDSVESKQTIAYLA